MPWTVLTAAGHTVRLATYAELAASDAFRHPLRHDAVHIEEVDVLVLPGGHAPGMRSCLESAPIQAMVAMLEPSAAG